MRELVRLRSTAYLAVKTKGDNRMPSKQGTLEGAYNRLALQDLRDMAKAILLEPQLPAMICSFLDHRAYIARPSVYRPVADFDGQGVDHAIRDLSADGRRETTRSRERNGCLRRANTFSMCKRGIAYGARALWRRSPHSSQRLGNPATGRSCDPFSRNGPSARDERLRPQVLITWGW